MNCPKCGKELMNVNGRYVCIECGTEVAENDVKDTQDVTSGINTESVVPPVTELPAEEPIESVQDIPIETEQPAAIEVPIEPVAADETTQMDTSTVSQELISDVAPVPEVSAEPSIDAQDNLSNIMTDTQEPTTGIETPVSELSTNNDIPVNVENAAGDAESLDIKSQIEQNLGPISSDILSTPNETTSLDQVDSSPVMTAELPVQPDVVTEPTDSLPETNNLGMSQSVPFDTLTTTNTFTPVEQNMPTEVPQVAPVETQVVVEENPVMSTQTEAQPVAPVFDTPVDPYVAADTTISQEVPSFATAAADVQPTQEAVFSDQTPQESVSQTPTTNNKPLFIILIAGAVFLLLLLIVGIIAYLKLTAPVA